MKKNYGINFFKLACSLKKSMACVNIAWWQSSIYSLWMFIIFFSNARLSLSIFRFVHHHVTHSFVLSIVFFYYIPHVLISNKCSSGSKQVSSLGYSQGFVVISHIPICLILMYIQSLIPRCLVWKLVSIFLLSL